MTSAYTIDRIRESVDLVSIAGEYMHLRPAGINVVGLCPFHKEKTPSFVIHPQKQLYHCKGCNRGGSVYDFLQAIEGISFPEALRRLAEYAGIPLDDQPLDPKAAREARREREEAEYWREISARALAHHATRLAAVLRGHDRMDARIRAWAARSHEREGWEETRGYRRAMRWWQTWVRIEQRIIECDAAATVLRSASKNAVVDQYRALPEKRKKAIRREMKAWREARETVIAMAVLVHEREEAATAAA